MLDDKGFDLWSDHYDETVEIHDDGIPDGVYFEVDLEGNMINVKENHLKLNIGE